jgi:hypothetical protein
MAVFELKAIPMITTGLFCFSVGAASGIAWMTSTGYKTSHSDTEVRVPSHMPPGPPMANPRNQLAALVIKLDQLTGKPLAVDLSEERSKRIHDLLSGVEDSLLQDDVALEKLRNILEILDVDRPTLIAVGYRWPNVPFHRPGMEPDPFSMPQNLEHLNSLRQKLEAPAQTEDSAP